MLWSQPHYGLRLKRHEGPFSSSSSCSPYLGMLSEPLRRMLWLMTPSQHKQKHCSIPPTRAHAPPETHRCDTRAAHIIKKPNSNRHHKAHPPSPPSPSPHHMPEEELFWTVLVISVFFKSLIIQLQTGGTNPSYSPGMRKRIPLECVICLKHCKQTKTRLQHKAPLGPCLNCTPRFTFKP